MTPPESVPESVDKETEGCLPCEPKTVPTAQILAEAALMPQQITRHLGINGAMVYRVAMTLC